jgi:O-antigen ligase
LTDADAAAGLATGHHSGGSQAGAPADAPPQASAVSSSSFCYVAGVAVAVIPWLNPFTGGPSAAAVPWFVSAASGVVMLMLASAGRIQPTFRLLAVSAAIVAWAAMSHPTMPDAVPALAAGLALVCLAATAATDASQGDALRIGLLIAAASSAAFGLAQYLGLSPAMAPWVNYAPAGEAYANLRQPNQYATLCWLGVAVVLWGAPRLKPAFATAAVCLLAAGSASSVSRTGVLQYLALFALCLIWRDERRRERLLLCLAAALAYLAATLVLPLLLEAVTGELPSRRLWSRLSGEYGCSSRAVLWANVARLVRERPLTGWGWGDLDYAHFVTPYSGARFCEILDNAHNLPLHLAVELGVPAALLVCAGAAIWAWRRRPWAEQDTGRQLAWAVLAVILVHSMLEYPLWYGPFQIAFGAALGWLSKDGSRPSHGAAAAKRASGFGLAVLMAGPLSYAAWDYWRVSQVYLAPDQRRAEWRADPLRAAAPSRLFAAQAQFAELTLLDVRRENAEHVAQLARKMLHYSPESRVVERLIEADTLLGNDAEAVSMLERFRAAYPRDYETWRAAKGLVPASSARAHD